MKNNSIKYRFLFAGGGTGGHLYPAVAVAEQIKILMPEAEILFVGAKNKIESRVLPKLGFNFKTIWVSGFARKLTLKNLLFPIKMLVSLIQSVVISLKFKPNVAVGTGAYVSGPAVWGAWFMGAKVILLEQNSYPGVTNRILENKAEQIHLTFEDSKQYFRNFDKTKVTGNPIRVNMQLTSKEEALKHFGLNTSKKTILVLGGSGGAKSINEAIAQLCKSTDAQFIWQTGNYYYDDYKEFNSQSIKVKPFIEDMNLAYSSADLVVCRSGATTIAEVAYLGLPVIFVPSSNVAADHQFKNAESIVNSGAALLLRDNELNLLKEKIELLLTDQNKSAELANKIKEFSKPDAAISIAKEAIALATKRAVL